MEIMPTHQVEKVTGDFKRMLTIIEETPYTRMINGVEKTFTTRKLKQVPDNFTEGYMVYYPQGHSILVAADDKELIERLQLFAPAKRVDMTTGEEVPESYQLTPKEIVARKQQRGERGFKSTGGIEAALEG